MWWDWVRFFWGAAFVFLVLEKYLHASGADYTRHMSYVSLLSFMLCSSNWLTTVLMKLSCAAKGTFIIRNIFFSLTLSGGRGSPD